MAGNTYADGTIILLVGTKRGLFLLTSKDRRSWSIEEPSLAASRVFNATLDQRSGSRIFAADNGSFFGSYLRYSDDFGQKWETPEQGIQFPESSEQSLKNIWIVEPGRLNEPDTVYAGVDPASLWISTDRGQSWDLQPGLESHPTRERWQPGAGGLCLHSIVPDYSNSERMWIGISAVGCVRTEDNGKTWEFANKNTRAGFLPDPYPEYGQCIHRLIQHPTRPDSLYQQNHCGIYKSENAGRDWIDIQRDLPSEFGFPIAVDRHNPETIFVIVENPEPRNNFPDEFVVFRSEDAGDTWERMTEGLPAAKQVSLGVLRHGMTTDGLEECGVYVGTTTGQLFASPDRGGSWQLLADFLPPIYSVNTAVIGRG
jgi:hypothetical protein